MIEQLEENIIEEVCYMCGNLFYDDGSQSRYDERVVFCSEECKDEYDMESKDD